MPIPRTRQISGEVDYDRESGRIPRYDPASVPGGGFERVQTIPVPSQVNLVGSIILLHLVSRFLLFAFISFGPPSFNEERTLNPGRPPPMMHFFLPDWILLFASLAAVLWSLDVWISQRKFVSRWGGRFEKLDALEKRFLDGDPPQS